MGAWIETHRNISVYITFRSHPEWVRGLKLPADVLTTSESKSHPEWVRGLKLNLLLHLYEQAKSHPEWVRGLKLAV